ncbi:MAG: hypothetical protein AB7O97_04200 [Planctomycetota bacterium]
MNPGITWTLLVAALPALFIGYHAVRSRPRLDVKLWGETILGSALCLGGAALGLGYVASKTGPELLADWLPEAKPDRYVGRRAQAFGIAGGIVAFSARVLGQDVGPRIVLGAIPGLMAFFGGLFGGMAVMCPLVAPFARVDPDGDGTTGGGSCSHVSVSESMESDAGPRPVPTRPPVDSAPTG